MSNLVRCLITAAVLSGPAVAQQAETFDGFLSDPVEVYDQNEEYLGDYNVGGIDAAAVKVLEVDGDMIKLDFGGQFDPGWVYRTDVKSKSGCRDVQAPKNPNAKSGGAMGMDNGSLCE